VDRADVQLSKRLSLVLRHRPESIGIRLDPQGWVDVGELLGALGTHGTGMSRDDLARVVTENDKQRFEWDRRLDRIRARQGHSRQVDLGLAPSTPPDVLFHGTPRRNLTSITATGLDRRRRHHVHLSEDRETARRVGARRGESVVLRVDAGAMAADGTTFWRTDNGAWLVDAVPARYLTLEDG
jgi:putative RNA 2'-phosphotransferase